MIFRNTHLKAKIIKVTVQFKILIVQLKAAAKRKVFSLDLKVVRVAADLQVSGSLFQMEHNN